MKRSKYEGHDRYEGMRNHDMKDFHSKRHGDMEGFTYMALAGIVALLLVLSWMGYRDNHPFNDYPIIEAQNDH